MAPVELTKWKPSSGKTLTEWKSRDAAELDCFDIPFAIKELIQNIVGQALKDIRAREWEGFKREDLRLKSDEEKRACKERLVATYPSLLTGPHGVSLTNAACLPLYVLSVDTYANTNLAAAVVLWDTSNKMNAISFFNNHLDAAASFDSFVVDGWSTSKSDEFAIGEKGKGFVLAMQFLFETLDKMWDLNPKTKSNQKTVLPQPGMSFRVGEELGEFKWRKRRKQEVLHVTQDDLTTRTVSEYLAHKYELDVDNNEDGGIVPYYYNSDLETKNEGMTEKAEKDLKSAANRRKKYGMDVNNKSVVKSDEVCITIVGLDTELQPETLFSAVYGIIPPLHAWRPKSRFIPGCSVGNVQFFLISGKPRFYLRDQFIPQGVHLNHLSINYHGDLTLSAERVMVGYDEKRIDFHTDLGASADYGFRDEPKLAIELAADILTDDHSDGIAGVLTPRDKKGAEQYRVAFDAAMRRQAPTTSLTLCPCSKNEEHIALYEQLDLKPFQVNPRALEILYESGAYLPIKDYARKILLESPMAAGAEAGSEEGEEEVQAMLHSDTSARGLASLAAGRDTGSGSSPAGQQTTAPAQPTYAKGLDRLRAVLQMVIPELEADAITIRKYDKVYPTAVWSEDNRQFAVALPKPCEEHGDGDEMTECFCWIIPVLEEAASTRTPDIPAKKVWGAFALCMGGGLLPKSAEAEGAPVDVDERAPVTSTLARPSTALTSSTAKTNTPTTSPRKSTSTSVRSARSRNAFTTTTSGLVSSGTPQTQSTSSTSTVTPNTPQTPQTSTISPTVDQTQSTINATTSTTNQSIGNNSTPTSTQQTPPNNTATAFVSAAGATNDLLALSPTPSSHAASDSYDLANEQALAQLTSAIRGQNALKRKHDVLEHENGMYRTTVVSQGKRIDQLNGRIVKLEEKNKSLLEEVEGYEQDAISFQKRMEDRKFKRQKTQL